MQLIVTASQTCGLVNLWWDNMAGISPYTVIDLIYTWNEISSFPTESLYI